MHKDIKRCSKFLSFVLRHNPEQIQLKIDQQGWVNVSDLLSRMQFSKNGISQSLLEEIVRADDKQRFSFSDDGKRIRANQGHSRYVDLGLKGEKPPKILYHGTAKKNIDVIFKQGVKKMKRQYVHLSEKVETARSVGIRYGESVILEISSNIMYEEGFKFYCSKNRVWLTEEVPAKYLKRQLIS